jgi:hypothetical protein
MLGILVSLEFTRVLVYKIEEDCTKLTSTQVPTMLPTRLRHQSLRGH